jgi:hypothetical protein
MSTRLKYLAAIWLVLSIVIGYELMGSAFQKGFEQGYVEGKASAELSEHEVFLQCTEWWFDGSASRAKQAIDQYCDRRLK